MNDSAEAKAAIAALRRISRNEDYKERVIATPLLRRVLLAAVSRFIGGEDFAGCLDPKPRTLRFLIALISPA